MSELSRDDVITVLGPLSDAVVAEIIATGITKEELVAARTRVIEDKAGKHAGERLPLGHLGRVVSIIERINSERGPLGESGSTLV